MKKYCKRILSVCIALALLMPILPESFNPTAYADEEPLLAFPGAMGFGASTAGGRGGEVRKVTNLNNSGPGSFRAAVAGDTAKIVVFEVSGIIRVLSNLEVGKNTTIAGQTSPAGISIYNFDTITPQENGQNGRIELNNNTIIRHLRIRGSRFGDSPIFALGQTKNVILDHVSLAWGGDDNLSFTTYGNEGAQDITVQWSTIEEPLEGWHEHPDERVHNYGMKLTGAANGNISVFYNLLTHVKRRNPSMDFGRAGMKGDLRNNVYYNSGAAFKVTQGTVDSSASEVGSYNYMNNYYKHGEDSLIMGYTTDTVELETIKKPISIYINGNYDSVYPGNYPSTNDLLHFPLDSKVTLLDEPVPVGTPYPNSTAAEAYSYVIAQAGAWPRDATTVRVVNDVVYGTGSMVSLSPSTIPDEGERSYFSQWIGNLDDNNFPNPAPPLDTDQDGMPDAWEDTHGLNKYTADHNGTDLSAVGYTNIEVYINERADTLLPAAPPAPVIPPPLPPATPLFEGENQSWSLSDGGSIFDLAGANGGKYFRINADAAGDFGQFAQTIDAGSYSVKAGIITSKKGGQFQLGIGGTSQGDTVDTYAETEVPAVVDLGTKVFSSTGPQTFRLDVLGKHSSATDFDIRIDYIKLEPVTAPPEPPGDPLFEGETQVWSLSDGGTIFDMAGANGGKYFRINADAAGDFGEFSQTVTAGTYSVKVGYVTSKKGGKFQLSIGGTSHGVTVDTYDTAEAPAVVNLGTKVFGSPGPQAFRFDIVDKHSEATDYDVRIDYVKLEPAAPPAPPLFSDDFEDGNANGWAGLGGTWSVVDDGSKVYLQSQTAGNYRAEAGSTAWTDQVIQAKIKPVVFNGANVQAGIRGRYTSTSNHYQLVLRSNNTVELSKTVGNVPTVLATASLTVNTGTWYTLKLEIVGNELKGYVDGILKVSSADSSLASGKLCVFVYKVSAEFDDIIVTEAP